MKVSVITVCKNCEKTLEKAIASVIDQTYRNIEFIVVDGRSTDGTLEILAKYKDRIDVLISEDDTGIYNAMNKGIHIAQGDIIYFLNSDDILHDNRVIEEVANIFAGDSAIDVLYGNVIMSDGKNRKYIKYGKINKKYFYKNTICHQTIFIRRSAFKKVGSFDETYVIHADTDWLLRAYFNPEISFHHFNRYISIFSTRGFCSDPVNADKYKLDRQKISAKFFKEARIKLFIKESLTQLGLAKY